MCCFSRHVEVVRGTRIFVRAEGSRQLVVYEMSLAAAGDLAMVLPVPVALPAREDDVNFVDLSESPAFFAQLDAFFDEGIAGAPKSRSMQSKALAVQQVGAFEASFVPSAADFDRLDPRFAIPSSLWSRVPSVAGFGFVVFKLRGATPSFLRRVLRAAPAPKKYHPMAFWFPRRDHDRLFFPTLHVHDGEVHETADFDHTLYAQSSALPEGWMASSAPLSRTYGLAKTMVSDALGYRRRITGPQPNGDLWIAS